MSNQVRILVVEDNRVNQLAMRALLSNAGYKCDVASNGQEALAMFKAGQYPIILMDVSMPVMDGFEASQAIRRSEFGTTHHTIIIACTALPEESRSKCIEAGMDDFIQKPVNTELLKRKLNEWLQEPAAAAAPISSPELLSEYSAEQVHQILETFLIVTETLMAELEAGISKHDEDSVKRVAHELKGSSSQVSAHEIARLCLNLEQAKNADNWTEIMRVYAALALAFTRVKTFISQNQYEALTRSSKTVD